MSVSISIARIVEKYTKNNSNHNVSIKWPNDIYVDNNKICGILIENKLQGSHIKESIIGVGLNVNQKVFHSDAPNPVSLIQLLQKELDSELLLKEILAQFSELMNPENETSVKEEYRQRLYRNKGYHIYRDANGEFSARIASVEDDGHLLLRLPDEQERRYAFKEVQFCIV
jgi:BirA family biotin operon repressor/biotin-[acetyl-CoA-carboxylase] ligase